MIAPLPMNPDSGGGNEWEPKIKAALRKQLYHWNSTGRIVIKWGSTTE